MPIIELHIMRYLDVGEEAVAVLDEVRAPLGAAALGVVGALALPRAQPLAARGGRAQLGGAVVELLHFLSL